MENSDIQYSYSNINSQHLLEENIHDSDTVLYFSHDYFARVQDKNEQLLQVAEIAKKLKVRRFLAVSHIEFANYHTQNLNEDPNFEINEIHDKVL